MKVRVKIVAFPGGFAAEAALPERYNLPRMGRPRWLSILLLIAALSPFVSPSQRDLFVGDETKYGRILLEMRETGLRLVPLLQGEPYTHKPPLHFWLIYLMTFVFGPNSTWPFVLPSLLSYLALIAITAWIARGLFGEESSLGSAFVFATAYFSWGLAQTARMDLMFTALLSAACYAVYRFCERGRFSQLNLAALLAGLAVLVKGPMAAVILIALVLIEWVRRRRLPRGNYLWPILILAAIPLLWLIPAILSAGESYAHELLVRQNLGRAVNAWVHKEPAWFYVFRAPATMFPWLFTFLMALLALWRNQDERQRNALRFCVNWMLAILIPYTLLSSKLDVYMMAMVVPLSLVAGSFIATETRERWSRRAAHVHAAVMILFGAIFLAAVLLAPRFVDELPELAMLERPIVAGYFWGTFLVAMASAGFALAMRNRGVIFSAAALAIAALFPMIYMTLFLMPIANDLGSTKPLVRAILAQRVPVKEVALHASPHLWARDMPEELRSIRYVTPESLLELDPKPTVIITRDKRADLLHLTLPRYSRVDQFRMRGKWFYVYRHR